MEERPVEFQSQRSFHARALARLVYRVKPSPPSEIWFWARSGHYACVYLLNPRILPYSLMSLSTISAWSWFMYSTCFP